MDGEGTIAIRGSRIFTSAKTLQNPNRQMLPNGHGLEKRFLDTLVWKRTTPRSNNKFIALNIHEMIDKAALRVEKGLLYHNLSHHRHAFQKLPA